MSANLNSTDHRDTARARAAIAAFAGCSVLALLYCTVEFAGARDNRADKPAANKTDEKPANPEERNTTATELRIRAVVDGKDELNIYPTAATWNHLEFTCPNDVEINGVKWNPDAKKRLENSGATRFLAEGVSFVKPVLKVHKGRGKVRLTQDPQHNVCLRLEDPGAGADVYELTLKFAGSPAATKEAGASGDPAKDQPQGATSGAPKPGASAVKAEAKKSNPKKPNAGKGAVANEEPDGDDGPPEPPPKFEYETVTLADGTKLQVEKWGETFKGYDARPPIELDDRRIQEVVNYEKLKRGANLGVSCLQPDARSGRMYWCEFRGTQPVSRIVSAKLDGTQLKDVADGLLSPNAMFLDAEKRRLYWFDGSVLPNVTLKTVDMNGGKANSLAAKIKPSSNATAYDPKREEFYYTEEARIIRVKPDGTGESLFLDGSQTIGAGVSLMEYDPIEDKLYWGNLGWIRRANRDGTSIEEVIGIDSGGQITSFAVDVPHRKVYWVKSSYGQLTRANLDGSQVEIVVMAPSQKIKDSPSKNIGGGALDLAHNKLYWIGGYYTGAMVRYATISRITVPPVLRPTERPSPPLIASIEPAAQRAGSEIKLSGKQLRETTAVSFIDDATRKHVPAKFNAIDDGSIAVTVPKLSDRCAHPVIVIQTPSGVTMTLLTTLTAIKPTQQRKHDRFRAGALAQLWLMPESQATEVEQALSYVERGAVHTSGGKGEMSVFAKSGSRLGLGQMVESVLYHEPFVIMSTIPDAPPSLKMIAVPAIRPSFLEALLTYEHN